LQRKVDAKSFDNKVSLGELLPVRTSAFDDCCASQAPPTNIADILAIVRPTIQVSPEA